MNQQRKRSQSGDRTFTQTAIGSVSSTQTFKHKQQ